MSWKEKRFEEDRRRRQLEKAKRNWRSNKTKPIISRDDDWKEQAYRNGYDTKNG